MSITITEDQRRQLRHDGFTVVRSVLSNDEVLRLRREIRSHLLHFGNFSSGGKAQPNAAIAVPEIGWAISHEHILKAIRELLQQTDIVFTSHCDIHMNRLSGWHKDSGGHDNAYFNGIPFSEASCQVYKVALYLQDHPKGSTGLSVRVGSHTTQDQQVGNVIDLATTAGDVVIFDVRLTHCGQEANVVEKLIRLASGGNRSRRFTQIKDLYWRLTGQQDRLAMFFTFGIPNEHTFNFSINNMDRQLSDGDPSKAFLPPKLKAKLEEREVQLAEQHFSF